MKSAIMFADIVGSTKLYERLGDDVAADCVNQCLKFMADLVHQHNGIVINTIGDEILCRFVEATDAIKTAMKIQEVFNQQPVNDHNVMLSLRIGIHYGEIVNREADVFGDVVNVAARVVGIANAKQILTTDDTVAQLSPEMVQMIRRYDRINLKGKQNPLTIYEVIREDRDITTMRSVVTGVLNNQCLQLIYNGVNKIVLHDSAPFVLGRSPECDLVVDAALVSRVHAYCTYRRGKFILIDQSTNGTFVQTADSNEVYLRREEMPLINSGLIGLGESTATDHGQILQFICA